ncbi:MAG: DNA mismatch repair endonuclease MutL [Planctomycetota bacterium]|nr:MAG: DNA mismatch repair endonuclease MutL [Planctomycetota bacterium]REK43338.1 MAG: DNA mismatch repair endonuclease MutL [Planctomycetota bacterium]
MGKIQQLPPHVVNKIAAGEVIERPASVVKELMENSVDAGASRIDVAIEQGGTQLIRVVDTGGGIAADDFALAVTSHATSKIESDDDLFRVGTLGFRGEALASIASVSRLRIRSRTADAAGGVELEVAGGAAGEAAPCGCPLGTIVEVRDLLFNTPVRRKFLRTTQTEMGHISEAFTRIALAQPQIHFTLAHNDRVVFDLPPAENWRQRIEALVDPAIAESLIAVDSREDDVRLAGYVAHPSHSRANNKMQYLLLNGRFIRDRSLQHALAEAYRGLLLTGRYPISFLRFEMPPELVDVNVHPTKLEVRFRDSGQIYRQLLGTLRTRFLTTDLTAQLQPVDTQSPASAHDAEKTESLRQEVVSWATAELAERRAELPPIAGGAMPGGAATIGPTERRPLELNRLDPAWVAEVTGPQMSTSPTSAAASSRDSTAEHEPGLSATAPTGAAAMEGRPTGMQVLDRYLISESDDGIVVIDQHALHERILYEQIREKVTSGDLETQSLLVPEPVDLSAEEAAAVIESRELLRQLAVEVEPFGGNTILISSYPAMLANWNPGELLRSLADQLTAGGKPPEPRDLLDELLHMIACKAAVKAGDRLRPGEVAALLEQRHLVDDSHHCPHGRPTSLVFSREQLDKQFKRT